MKRHLLKVFFIFCCVLLNASIAFSQTQTYWNEWIDHTLKYYKIPIAKNGIYRISPAQLSTAGIPVPAIDHHRFQLFFRGEEQYIYIQDNNFDNILNGSDYIEFYGQKNDGSLDSTLYKGVLYDKAVRQPNPYYSLFNDTSAYFLTWDSATNHKRIQFYPDTVFSSISIPANYFMKEDLVEYHNTYYYGLASSTNINFPEYHETEGWAGTNFYANSGTPYHSLIINTSNVYSSAAHDAQLKIAVMGASNDPVSSQEHDIQISYRDKNGTFVQLDHRVFDSYQLFDSAYSIPSSLLDASTEIRASALPGNYTSRNAVPYIVFKYPHNLDLESKNYYEMYVPAHPVEPKSKFSFTNLANPNTATYYIYDLTDHRKIPVIKNGSNFNALVQDGSQAEKFCVVKAENQFLPITSITPVGANGSFTDFSAAADSAFIIITHKSLMTGATAYANYRSSPAGGLHKVIVADIDELYDQFGYGIPKYPFSIRHFADFCADTFPTLPQNLFIIGKGIQTNFARNNSSNYANSLVPSVGYPTCDNMLVAVLNGNLLAPVIPIGRLAAKNNADVQTYLDKVKEYEQASLTPEEWMKHLIHMGGGANQYQQKDFSDYLHGYEAIIEDTSFGGFVHHFSKNSSSPTQTSYTDSIKGLINDGVSIITFFGHTSASVFEFNLLPPDEYKNDQGKYPFFIANGCVAGDIYQPIINGSISSSEVYTLDKQGMIGFLASSGPGTAGQLNIFTSNLYKAIGQTLYGQPVGKCIQAAIDNTEGTAQDELLIAACLEMTLHGDPSIVIHSPKKPDYEVTSQSVRFDPPYVSSDMDSFDVKVIVANVGKAVNNKVKVEIRRTFTDGTSITYYDTLPYVHFKDTLTFTLPVDPIHGPGLNKFGVRVDYLDEVDEIENVVNNNLVGSDEVHLFIYSGDVIPVYPYRYAIVPNDTITLKAYTSNPFVTKARYIFEIDTTDLFNSPQKRTQYVTQMGAVLKASYNLWSTSLVLVDSTVYFWRVRRDTSDTANFHWRESSFQYIPNKRGWGQSHFFQFLKGDKFNYIDTNRLSRDFSLANFTNDLTIHNVNYTVQGGGAGINAYINSSLELGISSNVSSDAKNAGVPTPPHVQIFVIDAVTGLPWHKDSSTQYGSYPSNAKYRFEFLTSTPAQQQVLVNFLVNTIPCGSKVIFNICDNHNMGTLVGGSTPANPALVAALQAIGGTQFTSLQNDFPYTLSGRKCGSGKENVGTSISDTIFLNDSMLVKRESGSIYSEIIGPASKWNSLHWKFRSPEAGSNPAAAAADTIVITLIGHKAAGGTDTIFKAITKDSLDILNLDQLISASTYPHLQLNAWVKDTVLRTPAQLSYWRIYYEGVPDAALNPAKHYTFYNPVVQQGDSMSMSVAIENIGDYAMDSIWVKFWVYDANRNYVFIDSMKMDSLPIDSVVIPKVKFSTLDLPGGLSSLWVEANPFNSQHQLEQYHFNNIGTIPFTVNEDNINPVLDVTFDGVHIMNGDIVSAKPSVLVRLKDENTFLALNDTTDFEIYLKRPGASTFERIHFVDGLMSFEPAILPNNSCRINYTPELTDGTYALKVQATDRSGNLSGNIEYKITFEVINKPTVTSVLNYPNPFSTSTKFVFTLTGSEVPDYFKIQILTISGKIVRELNKYDLGPIHIGRNITEYAWDGKDDFGDQLANGLYLYRVMTQLNGKALEHRETDADPFFTQGYGKMYLIR